MLGGESGHGNVHSNAKQSLFKRRDFVARERSWNMVPGKSWRFLCVCKFSIKSLNITRVLAVVFLFLLIYQMLFRRSTAQVFKKKKTIKGHGWLLHKSLTNNLVIALLTVVVLPKV